MSIEPWNRGCGQRATPVSEVAGDDWGRLDWPWAGFSSVGAIADGNHRAAAPDGRPIAFKER